LKNNLPPYEPSKHISIKFAFLAVIAPSALQGFALLYSILLVEIILLKDSFQVLLRIIGQIGGFGMKPGYSLGPMAFQPEGLSGVSRRISNTIKPWMSIWAEEISSHSPCGITKTQVYEEHDGG
jgi:hypothetical protein